MFARGTIFERYPYLLPNLVSASVVLIGLVVGILFLDETHEQKKYRPDPGRDLGRWIVASLSSPTDDFKYSKIADANIDETSTLIDEHSMPPSYSSSDACLETKSMKTSITPADNCTIIEHDDEGQQHIPKPAATRAITPQVLLNVVSYGILA